MYLTALVSFVVTSLCVYHVAGPLPTPHPRILRCLQNELAPLIWCLGVVLDFDCENEVARLPRVWHSAALPNDLLSWNSAEKGAWNGDDNEKNHCRLAKCSVQQKPKCKSFCVLKAMVFHSTRSAPMGDNHFDFVYLHAIQPRIELGSYSYVWPNREANSGFTGLHLCVSHSKTSVFP